MTLAQLYVYLVWTIGVAAAILIFLLGVLAAALTTFKSWSSKIALDTGDVAPGIIIICVTSCVALGALAAAKYVAGM